MAKNPLFRECLAAIPEERKGMTQRELAKRLGKRESEVSKWLTGRHNFTTNTIARISLALDAPIINVASSIYNSAPTSQTTMVAEDIRTI